MGPDFSSTATLGCAVFTIAIHSGACDDRKSAQPRAAALVERPERFVGRGFSRDVGKLTLAGL